jgi:hypothetical protein
MISFLRYFEIQPKLQIENGFFWSLIPKISDINGMVVQKYPDFDF